jgi:hypothetical protein
MNIWAALHTSVCGKLRGLLSEERRKSTALLVHVLTGISCVIVVVIIELSSLLCYSRTESRATRHITDELSLSTINCITHKQNHDDSHKASLGNSTLENYCFYRIQQEM